VRKGDELAIFLVYDRPDRVRERPGLERVFFAQRCVSDTQLEQMVDAFRAVGAYVELFAGEQPFVEALANGRVQQIDRSLKVVYNGIEGGIAPEGFQPGRKALLPAIADSYGVVCSNSNAYACALGRHKFHYLTVLQSLGLTSPRTWHFRNGSRWAGGRMPDPETKVIAKSTYESWSVGVTEDSVFRFDESSEERVAEIARQIGQPVTVQEFIAGTEVCVPVLATPEPFITPPVRATMAKAPTEEEAFMTVGDNLREGGVSHEPFAAVDEIMERIQHDALAAFDILQLDAFARIDFRLDRDGRAWLFDVGVSPGVSTKSSAFRSISSLGFTHSEFLRIAVAATLATEGLL
jgi:D-alanine-D-alanine ligase